MSAASHAYSLWNRDTDDSVCDLSPNTSYKLTTRTFVEAGTRDLDHIYTRLALRAVTQNCKDGQTLILHSDDGDEYDARWFKATANKLCAIADVRRSSVATSQRPQAFEMRCQISKIKEASDWLTKTEAEKSTEAMIAEGAPRHDRQTSGNNPTSPFRDCNGKPTMAAILFGGGGCK